MIRILFSFALIISLTSCTGHQCIEADDFGHIQLEVSSRYTQEELMYQQGEQQIAPWRYSGYKVNGRPLTILVRNWKYGDDLNEEWELSAWCPWFGVEGEDMVLAKFCERLLECKFDNRIKQEDLDDAPIVNAPCVLKKGVGLYGLIADSNTDPNATLNTKSFPKGLTFHLGEKNNNYSMLEVSKKGIIRETGGISYNYTNKTSPNSIANQYLNNKLFFKILDKHYDDNNGKYILSIKSGIDSENIDFLNQITNYIKNTLFGDISNNNYGIFGDLYREIVNNPSYRNTVSALLTLYVIITILGYLVGIINLNTHQLISRVIKIAIISVLLSKKYSWSFFYNYLFIFFTRGMDQILSMISDSSALGSGSDSIISMMVASQTLAKLFSLLFIEWTGFLYIILFFFVLLLIVIIYFKAMIIYLVASLAIGMIIIMAPIFLCFLLFEVTRSFFENWLKQLISYSIQPIILFAGLAILSNIIRSELYGSLGFTVCKYDFPKLSEVGDIFGTRSSFFYWWFPKPMQGNDFSRKKQSILIPLAGIYSNEKNTIKTIDGSKVEKGTFCNAYECIDQRYPDLPYLDPNKDKRRIEQFWNGKFVQFDGMLIIFVATLLLSNLNQLAIYIGNFLSSTSGNQSNIASIGDNAAYGMKNYLKNSYMLAKLYTNKTTSVIKGTTQAIARTPISQKLYHKLNSTKAGRNFITGTKIIGNTAGIIGQTTKKAFSLVKKINTTKDNIKNLPSDLADQLLLAKAKRKALSKKPNKTVASLVYKNTGISKNNIKKEYIKEYKTALIKQIRQTNPYLTNQQIEKKAWQLTNLSFDELKDELKKLNNNQDLTAKEYDYLSNLEKKSSLTKRFQNEYLKAYIELSNQKVDIFGRNIKIIGEYQKESNKKQDLLSYKPKFKAFTQIAQSVRNKLESNSNENNNNQRNTLESNSNENNNNQRNTLESNSNENNNNQRNTLESNSNENNNNQKNTLESNSNENNNNQKNTLESNSNENNNNQKNTLESNSNENNNNQRNTLESNSNENNNNQKNTLESNSNENRSKPNNQKPKIK